MITPRTLTLTATAALALWMVLWFGWLARPDAIAPAIAALIAIVPLLLLAWPLARNHAAAYAWCGFISLGYMAHALTEIFAGAADRNLAIVELFLVGIWFVASGAALRIRRAQLADGTRS